MKDDEDLAHYRDQPDRLIEEFRKMRMAKNKATQFAVEAKQAAQKVSTTVTIKPLKKKEEVPTCTFFAADTSFSHSYTTSVTQ